MKIGSSTLALALGAFVTFSSAAQIQGFVSGYAPGNVKEKKEVKGVESSRDLHTDFMWGLGAEYLAFPVGPLMVGGGLGFFSVQTDGGYNVVMPSVPLWLSVGVIGPDSWKVRPYLGARVGYPIPATNYLTWWDKPQDFFVTGNVGVQLPYHMGVEFDCTYLTMDKYFSKHGVNFRLSSVKFGGSITVHFDLSGKSAEADKAATVNDAVVAEPVVEENYDAYAPSSVNENSESTDPYSNYGEPAAENMTGEPSAEPAYDAAPAEEQPAAESSEVAPVEEPAAEAPAEESPAEEAVAEEAPAEEPAAEPAPEPEKKPVAKKATSKKKAAAKKTTKKKAAAKKKTSKKKK